MKTEVIDHRDSSEPKFINPFTDYGFKRIFGTELSKDILEIPKFRLPLSECSTLYEKLLYVFKNMNILERMPKELQNQVLTKLKNIAEIAQMSPDERLTYEISLLHQYDTESVLLLLFEEVAF